MDGSSTVYPISEAVAEEFRAYRPDVNVVLGESGTGGGMKKFSRKEIDICNASRLIKPSEKKACINAGVEWLELEIAYDGLAVVVHPQNSWVDKLSVTELKMIWESESQNKIRYWDQIRPEWPHREIHLYGPGTASGTYEYFTEVICGEKGNSRGDFNANEDDNTLVNGIAGDPGALGYFGLAFYEHNKNKLKLIPVDDNNGGVIPTVETVLNQTYTPLARPLYIYINKHALLEDHMIEFIDFYIDRVGPLAAEVGYVPLQDSLYADMKLKIAAFRKEAGTTMPEGKSKKQ